MPLPASGRALTKLLILASVLALCIFIAVRGIAFYHLFRTHAGLLLTQDEVKSGHLANTTPLVPQLIHQIYFNFTDPSNLDPPAEWAAARQSCIDHNYEWRNILWTEEKGRTFLSEEYEWILPMYDDLSFPVQRTDVLRYFLMRHFGGIYIDMDNGCTASLDPLRHYPAFVADGGRGTLSNDMIGAEPNHPFWIEMTSSLQAYNWKYPLPYVTVSYATGQWFETEIWERYHRQHPDDEDRLFRILTDGREEAPPAVFFTHTFGATWDNWDNQYFAWVGTHLKTVIGGAIVAIIVVIASVVLACRLVKTRRPSRKDYIAVRDLELDECQASV